MNITKNGKLLMAMVGVIFCSLASAKGAQAQTIDLTTLGASGSIGSGFFQQIDNSSTGTGLISSFAEIGGNTDVVQGYNTTVNNTLDNASSDTFNHELLLTDVPVVNVSGTDYRQFLLDVNQTGQSPQLSLDEIQIFQSTSANQNVTTFNGSGVLNLASSNLVYRLDDGTNNWIKLDYSLNTGSGSGDMFAYIPNSLFTSGDQYVYLYSKFGVNIGNNDGFEEWAVAKGTITPNPPPVVPEPMSMLLMGGGLGLAGFMKRRKLITC